MSMSVKAMMAIVSLSLITAACERSHKKNGDSPSPAAPGKPATAAAIQSEKENKEKLSSVFSKIDADYNVEDRAITQKVDGISVEPVEWINDMHGDVTAKIMGTVLFAGMDKPVLFTSEYFSAHDAQQVHRLALSDIEDTTRIFGGAIVVASFQCLDKSCKQIALFFKADGSAGFILKNDGQGYRIVNSMGTSFSREEAQTERKKTQMGPR